MAQTGDKKSMKKHLLFSKRILIFILKRTPVVRKHPRLRSRIDCITDACSLVYKKRSEIHSKAFISGIERRLSWFGINFDQLPGNQKSDLYRLFSGLPLRPARYDELKHHMKEAPADLLLCKQWLDLHKMCCFRGRYTLAQIFREKARVLAISPIKRSGSKPPISWDNTIGAVIEGGECNRREYLDHLLARAGATWDVASKWHLYAAVLTGQVISSECVRYFDGSDFAGYLAGKSIAIVGPAPTEALNAEEIDSHDIVVRLNHSFEGKGVDQKHKGLRTDVSCFNGEQAKNFIDERNGILPKEITWGCFKSPGVVSYAEERNKDKYARSHIRFDKFRFHGSFNMIPIVALDLALFNAKYIKIYHTDLMLTVARQKGYYPDSFDRSTENVGRRRNIFRRASMVHDPIQQYRILRRLWSAGKITGDVRFGEVMEMGLDAYLRDLESVYSSSHLHAESGNA